MKNKDYGGYITMDGTIRMATLKDAEAILAIYEPYILETAITFEYDKIPIEQFRDRMAKVMEQFPWLVYEEEGKILGYAYGSKFKERAAFGWDCECSVYLDREVKHRGIGTKLYKVLIDLIQRMGYVNLYALLTYPNEASMALHEKFGFAKVGIYQKTGYKFGQWWDLLVMEKRIGSVEGEPGVVKSIEEILH
jgi:phosphinothricin acetyltransferase